MPKPKIRCWWSEEDPLYIDYHDHEWGVPEHDDKKLFEMLILEGFQAGLSWLTILRKREHFRKAFDNFNPHKIAKYTKKDLDQLLKNENIIRSRLKIAATVSNAQLFLAVQKEFGTFDRYLWQFTNYKTLRYSKGYQQREIPASSLEAEKMAKDLKKRGFKFVGPKICYALMQAIGMVDDHVKECYKSKL